MKKEVHIGCSSFYTAAWRDVFYPKELPTKEWFDYYCKHFDTFEVNATFYKFPTLRIFQNWFNRTPDDFLLSVKAPKLITHINKFIDCERLLDDFYTRALEGLKHKLASVLFQFPPSYHYSQERLELIISKLNLYYNNVLEFRHESWWMPEVENKLAENNITLCSVSHPNLPETIFMASSQTYFRLHGRPSMFYSDYGTVDLEKFKDLILNNNSVKKVFVYFNNTASISGILNAVEMKKLF
ncbi:DUF72 domain-containing protein [Flavobacterium sp.]|uniref:DUF72 domain-containing protein n=1 Tax=Flavobacterium sp. TaxID=239 RepID=UPI0025DAFA98|nr:DUF72 domain-containing protein [Flavobacterium sp.]